MKELKLGIDIQMYKNVCLNQKDGRRWIILFLSILQVLKQIVLNKASG